MIRHRRWARGGVERGARGCWAVDRRRLVVHRGRLEGAGTGRNTGGSVATIPQWARQAWGGSGENGGLDILVWTHITWEWYEVNNLDLF